MRVAALRRRGSAHRFPRAAVLLLVLVMTAQMVAWGAADGEQQAAAPAAAPATLVVFNRPIVTFRATLFGYAPAERAVVSRQRIESLLDRPGPGSVAVQDVATGKLVLLDGVGVFFVTGGDINPLEGEALDAVATSASASLEAVVKQAREQRSISFLLKAGALALTVTIVYLVLVRVVFALRRRLGGRVAAAVQARVEKVRVAGVSVVHPEVLGSAVGRAITLLAWTAALLLTYLWLAFVLQRFPYTRPWGERLGAYLLDLLETVGAAIVGAIPGLLLVAFIYVAARFASQLLDLFFRRAESGQLQLRWLDPETAVPTRRIATIVLWLFALSMAYPYLPGSHTEAFRGLSVLLGLMISLGGASVVGQALSGLSLMYQRALHPGEYVRIGDLEGTVMSLGFMRTIIQTGQGEEISVPNSTIVAAPVRNFSRLLDGKGFVLQPGVTIGYSTPWRQVHAMLLEAARRTQGVLPEPPPYVIQTALSDFYVEYRLVAWGSPAEPQPRAKLMNELHANIQDVFNEYDVQIMSPHYMTDPEHPQVVPKAKWFAAPAVPREPDSGRG
jgi:small-conductance mechanosensitive channel